MKRQGYSIEKDGETKGGQEKCELEPIRHWSLKEHNHETFWIAKNSGLIDRIQPKDLKNGLQSYTNYLLRN